MKLLGKHNRLLDKCDKHQVGPLGVRGSGWEVDLGWLHIAAPRLRAMQVRGGSTAGPQATWAAPRARASWLRPPGLQVTWHKDLEAPQKKKRKS